MALNKLKKWIGTQAVRAFINVEDGRVYKMINGTETNL